jgi:Zn-dependent M28 family amino/carboxypeptidase
MSTKTPSNKLGKASGLCALVLVATILQGCQPELTQLPPFDGQQAYSEVEALVEISPRDAGTPAGRKAAEHIYKRLESFGIEAKIDSFEDQTPAGKKTMHNVVGRIPGKTDQWIILGSHFDTMPGIENFQGANDSGSSTGVLLELARMLGAAKTNPETGIIFAFFDGEEGIAGYIPGDGLHGSRHMANQLKKSGEHKKIKAMILLDMVGDKDLHFTIPANCSHSLIKEVLDAAHTTGHRNRFSLSRNSIITDDHVPFLEAGIPAIDIIDFRFGSKPELNDHWHTDADQLKNISAQSLEISGTITLQILKQLTLGQNPD